MAMKLYCVALVLIASGLAYKFGEYAYYYQHGGS